MKTYSNSDSLSKCYIQKHILLFVVALPETVSYILNFVMLTSR